MPSACIRFRRQYFSGATFMATPVFGLQVRCGQVFAVILNRLSANMMPDHWKPKEWCDMEATVQLTQSTPRIHTPGELVRSLVEDFGASVDMRIVTRITSFGKGVRRTLHCSEVFSQGSS